MKITIVTVVKDDLTGFIKTLDSIKKNRVEDCFQYVVVDSSANREVYFYCKGIEFITYVHILPNGIFRAMNHSLEYIDSKSYVFFLNSGDVLLPKSLIKLKEVFKGDADVVYGNLAISGKKEVPLPLEFLNLGEIPFSHQSVFVQLKLIKFDSKLNNVADMELFLRLYSKNVTFKYVNIEFAEVAEMKCSKKRMLQIFETYSVLLRNKKIHSIFIRLCLSVFFKKIFSPNDYH